MAHIHRLGKYAVKTQGVEGFNGPFHAFGIPFGSGQAWARFGAQVGQPAVTLLFAERLLVQPFDKGGIFSGLGLCAKGQKAQRKKGKRFFHGDGVENRSEKIRCIRPF